MSGRSLQLPTLCAHRGVSARAPENSLPAVRLAWQEGIPRVEVDVRLSCDGVPVCFHDERLDRLTPERGPVSSRTWDQLRQIPLMPGAFEGAFPEARIPRLRQVCETVPGHGGLIVELKLSAGEPVGPLVEAVPAELAGFPPARVRLISFSAESLALAGRWPRGLIVRTLSRETIGAALRARATAIHVDHRGLAREGVAAAHADGLAVNAWTVNSAKDLAPLLDWGVDEVTSDDPTKLAAPEAREDG